MFFKEKQIKGVFEIENKAIEDDRGFFMRTYDNHLFQQKKINTKGEKNSNLKI